MRYTWNPLHRKSGSYDHAVYTAYGKIYWCDASAEVVWIRSLACVGNSRTLLVLNICWKMKPFSVILKLHILREMTSSCKIFFLNSHQRDHHFCCSCFFQLRLPRIDGRETKGNKTGHKLDSCSTNILQNRCEAGIGWVSRRLYILRLHEIVSIIIDEYLKYHTLLKITLIHILLVNMLSTIM